MPRSSKVGLAAANRFKDNPLWDREWHEKILDKLHKGVAKSQLRELNSVEVANIKVDCRLKTTK